MQTIIDWLFGTAGDAPLGACLAGHSAVTLIQLVADSAIALSYFGILAGLVWFLRHRLELSPAYRTFAWLMGLFLLSSAFTHIVSITTLYTPSFGLAAVIKGTTAFVSTATVALLWPLLPSLARTPSSAQLAEANEKLRREVAGHESTLYELEAIRRELEIRVEERTRELSLVKARFETALRGANIHAYSQDRDLRYTWAYVPNSAQAANDMLGRTDDEILPATEKDTVIAVKRRVLETGTPENCELSYVMPQGRALFALHVEPVVGPFGRIEGLTCAAIDISRMRSLESEQRRLADELRTALQRYETALRGSHVTVFTQDPSFRFTSISNPLFGLRVDEILGRTDADILPVESGAQFRALEQSVLASGQARGSEVSVLEDGKTRWYDLHVEPLPDVTGNIAGLACAAVDVTERKAGEAHLRLLMRELTHRSKNLLAVIQAMARQTARHAGTIEAFLERFNARLQALATSHDLLIQEGWYGASLDDLTRRQLAEYLDGAAARVSVEGPAVHLKPIAAQSLGLALHELANNAEKFGALSVPDGRVAITWRRLAPTDGNAEAAVEIVWAESGGPEVAAPARRGFGSLVVEQNLSRALDAEVQLTFGAPGVRCRMVIPATHVLAGR